MLVVDALEAVEIVHNERQRPAVASRSRQLAVKELEQVALVVGVGQGINNRQAINFLVVFGFHVAAGQEPVNAIADAKVIAILELGYGGRHVVDKRAIGALQIDSVI